MVGPTLIIVGLDCEKSYQIAFGKEGITVSPSDSGSQPAHIYFDEGAKYFGNPFPLHDIEQQRYIEPFDYFGSSICTNSIYIKTSQSSPWIKGTKVIHHKPDTSIGNLLEGEAREVFHPPKTKDRPTLAENSNALYREGFFGTIILPIRPKPCLQS